MFSRVVLVASLLTACAVATVAVCVACRAEQKQFELDTSSPDATYLVHLKERLGVARPTHHDVLLDISKGELSLLKGEQFNEGGVYDDTFSVLYPEHNWISPFILRFGHKDDVPTPQHDEIGIENATERTLTYLRIDAGKYETFLLLELKAGSSLTLKTQPQTDVGQDLSYIGCKGRFDDGTSIEEQAANFSVRGKYRGPAHYGIRISERGVVISSNDFESLSKTR